MYKDFDTTAEYTTIYTVYCKRGEPGFLDRTGAPEFLCQPLDVWLMWWLLEHRCHAKKKTRSFARRLLQRETFDIISWPIRQGSSTYIQKTASKKSQWRAKPQLGDYCAQLHTSFMYQATCTRSLLSTSLSHSNLFKFEFGCKNLSQQQFNVESAFSAISNPKWIAW